MRRPTTKTSAEHPFPLTVQCVCNNRTLTGPVVFIATEEDGVSIDRCAILYEQDTGPSFEWYHLFRFEDSGEALELHDQGVHERTEPILLHTGEYTSPLYWRHKQVKMPVVGGKQVLLHRIPNALENTAACFAEALPSSIYCSTCRREYMPGPHVPLLQEAARRGYVTTFCDHSFWCSACKRWSTPTERTPRLATGEGCTHPRPAGWESRLTNKVRELNAPSLELAHADLSHALPSPHPYWDGTFQDQYYLGGMLFPPRHHRHYLAVPTDENPNA